MVRLLTPELLDALPPSDNNAKASRRDLSRINSLMGNGPWLQHEIRKAQKRFQIQDWVELGAGEGQLGWQFFQRFGLDHLFWTGVDFLPRPELWPDSWDWHQGDLFQWRKWDKIEGVIACLVLHHFSNNQLAELGKKIQLSCRYFLAVEPVRRKLHLWQARFLTSCGMNSVTRHDAQASVRAGFWNEELREALGLGKAWQTKVQQTWRGAYRFIAWKN